MDERVRAIINYHAAQVARAWRDTWHLPSVRGYLLALALGAGGAFTEWRLDPQNVKVSHLLLAAALPVGAYIVLVAVWNLALAPYRMANDARVRAEGERDTAVADARRVAAEERLDHLNSLHQRGQALRKDAIRGADVQAITMDYEDWSALTTELVNREFPDCRSLLTQVYGIQPYRGLLPPLARIASLLDNHLEGIVRIIGLKSRAN